MNVASFSEREKLTDKGQSINRTFEESRSGMNTHTHHNCSCHLIRWNIAQSYGSHVHSPKGQFTVDLLEAVRWKTSLRNCCRVTKNRYDRTPHAPE